MTDTCPHRCRTRPPQTIPVHGSQCWGSGTRLRTSWTVTQSGSPSFDLAQKNKEPRPRPANRGNAGGRLMERENLAGDVKEKRRKRLQPRGPKVPMRRRGADCPVVVKRAGGLLPRVAPRAGQRTDGRFLWRRGALWRKLSKYIARQCPQLIDASPPAGPPFARRPGTSSANRGEPAGECNHHLTRKILALPCRSQPYGRSGGKLPGRSSSWPYHPHLPHAQTSRLTG
jgi:hypothetical protein